MRRTIQIGSAAKAAGWTVGLAIGTFVSTAAAEHVIEQPRAHPQYFAELEPHLSIGWIGPPGDGRGNGYGGGVLASFELVDPGFIPDLNNTVAISVGFDLLNYGYGDKETVRYAWIPVVMQWNFFVASQWSVFGEPGLAIRVPSKGSSTLDPLIIRLGGRWHFTDNLAVTVRIGYPYATVGLSVLL